MQLVASRRGVAALPQWAVQQYLDREYVTARPIGSRGLVGKLYAACLPDVAQRAYVQEFVAIVREAAFLNLRGVALLD